MAKSLVAVKVATTALQLWANRLTIFLRVKAVNFATALIVVGMQLSSILLVSVIAQAVITAPQPLAKTQHTSTPLTVVKAVT